MLVGAYSKYKHVEKGTIKIKDKFLGIATNLEILCSRCLDKAVALTSLSRLKCTNVIENLNDHKRSNSYSLNIKLVLDTMASDIDPSNMSQLLSFLDIPQCKLLHERFFRIIELTIGYICEK